MSSCFCGLLSPAPSCARLQSDLLSSPFLFLGLPQDTCFPKKLLSTMKNIAISKPSEGPEPPLMGCFNRSDSTDESKPRSTWSGGSCTPSQQTPLNSNLIRYHSKKWQATGDTGWSSASTETACPVFSTHVYKNSSKPCIYKEGVRQRTIWNHFRSMLQHI